MVKHLPNWTFFLDFCLEGERSIVCPGNHLLKALSKTIAQPKKRSVFGASCDRI